MNKSILQSDLNFCYACGCNYQLEFHHIFFGTANRKVSDKYNLTCMLCLDHHRGQNGVHTNNRELDLFLKEQAQKEFEKTHSREEFIKLIGRNYLD